MVGKLAKSMHADCKVIIIKDINELPLADIIIEILGCSSFRVKRRKEDQYRALTPAESRKDKFRQLKERIGQHFRDRDDNLEFVIDGVVMPTKQSGKGSNTPFFRFFEVSEFLRPTAVRELQYTPCAEINRADYAEWIPRGNSALALGLYDRDRDLALALAVMSKTPKDPNRDLNQTKDGKPLNYRKAVAQDPDLWILCDIEEWHRLFENTCIPIYSSEVPIAFVAVALNV
jgi:hypothetical protein